MGIRDQRLQMECDHYQRLEIMDLRPVTANGMCYYQRPETRVCEWDASIGTTRGHVFLSAAPLPAALSSATRGAARHAGTLVSSSELCLPRHGACAR